MTDQTSTAGLSYDDVVALEQILAEDAKLAETADRIAERRTQIRSILADKLPDGTTALAGRQVIISVPNRLDNAAIERAYPVTSYPHLYRPALDTKAVRDNIAPAQLAALTKAGQRQVTVR